MLLTITLKHEHGQSYLPSDLGYLLHKHPDHHQQFELRQGVAHVFYPEVSETTCQAALWVDIDAVELVKRFRGPSGEGHALTQYVNDRPYVASSFMSVAIARVFGSALNGNSRERQSLADSELPFEVTLPVLPCRGGASLLRNLFEPLGYSVTAERLALDDRFEEWGESAYYSVTLTHRCRLKHLLSHLYVLIPVLDNDKHYWVSESEIEKLQRHGEEWVAEHPMKTLIVKRYMKGQIHLSNKAMASLTVEEGDQEEALAEYEELVEAKSSLNDQRLSTVVDLIKARDAESVIDLGCGEGKLLQRILPMKGLQRVVGMDVSIRALERAEQRLKLDQKPEKVRAKLTLMQGALQYRDARLEGFDMAVCMEVIEHMDEDRLDAFEKVLFQYAKPKTAVVTTPNAEYNVKYENLPVGKLRHSDHRFEWDRATFNAWADTVADRFGYAVEYRAVGDLDAQVGTPTQMAVFTRAA